MKIAVLGSNGFLSNTLIGYYGNFPNILVDVYGLDKPKGLFYNHFFPLNLVEEDLRGESIKDYDIIVYCIGAGIQFNLNEDNDLIYKLNVSAPVTICNLLDAIGYKGIFITFGSYFEIGATELRRPLTEKEVLFSAGYAPNDYTVSKRMLSRYVDSSKHSFTYWHFILPTIYGKGENPQRLIPYVINALSNNQKVTFTDGNQVRQYIYVGMIPAIIMNAYDNKLMSGIYNIEGNEILSVREIVSLIFGFMNRELPQDVFGSLQRQDSSMRYLAIDGSLLKSKINIVYNTTILSSLSNYYIQ